MELVPSLSSEPSSTSKAAPSRTATAGTPGRTTPLEAFQQHEWILLLPDSNLFPPHPLSPIPYHLPARDEPQKGCRHCHRPLHPHLQRCQAPQMYCS